MSSSILMACGLTDELKTPKVIFIKENSGVDGNFLISCLLGQRLKQRDHKIFLHATHHNFQHYSNACMKLGSNINLPNDSGQLKFHDVKKLLFDSNFHNSTEIINYENLFATFVTFINENLPHESNRISIIFDDLSFYLNFNSHENDLIKFIEKIVEFIEIHPRRNSIFLVLKLNNSELYEYLCNNLAIFSDCELIVSQLKSGRFREVDGHLDIYRIKSDESGDAQQQLIDFKVKEKSILFKVNERNIKVFVPGEFGIKIV
uniref:Elongator complex protein 6 n=1 Tax=Corethrella appendiculata TaxID=1370023 RepID=U5EX87_9DIPT